jgi:type I restriction enzyme R subunit
MLAAMNGAKIRPEWHSGDLKKGVIKVVMTSDTASDGPEIAIHHTTKEQRPITKALSS